MQEALEALPWVRRVEVDYGTRTATVKATAGKVDTKALIKALQDAGFGGKLLSAPKKKMEEKKGASSGKARRVTLVVTGMRKSLAGAT